LFAFGSVRAGPGAGQRTSTSPDSDALVTGRPAVRTKHRSADGMSSVRLIALRRRRGPRPGRAGTWPVPAAGTLAEEYLRERRQFGSAFRAFDLLGPASFVSFTRGTNTMTERRFFLRGEIDIAAAPALHAGLTES
jgi:hypothetical protein